MDTIIQNIGTARVIAILRHQSRKYIEQLLPRLVGAGLAVVEVSRTADDFHASFAALRSEFGTKLLIGVGTVRTERESQEALDLGAQFLISPHFNAGLTEFLLHRNVPYIVGCYTPTEVAAALELAPMAIKIFPAFVGGPKYISSLLGPFPGTRFVPTGGVHPADANDYWNAGAWAVAIGSEMNSIGEWTDEQLRALFSRKAK
jgi:2-dehydro-3-deoxyphosphogluconate aldolase/(4S)-4-hydroxy-2-oxoglutarate aldolase